jgi:hypothetical protein
MYYGWFDDNPKKTAAFKIEEAIEAYVRRFGKRPNLVLVNEFDVADVKGVAVRPESFIRRNNFWVGWEEALKSEPIVPAKPVKAAKAAKLAA